MCSSPQRQTSLGPKFRCVRDTVYFRKKPWAYEIIEFPAIVLDLDAAASGEIDVFEAPRFHRFVRPTENPRRRAAYPTRSRKRRSLFKKGEERHRLSDFCTELTGIEQATVDAAQPLDVARRPGCPCLESLRSSQSPSRISLPLSFRRLVLV